MLSSLRAFATEPAIPDPPRRVWRDWALVGVFSVAAILEAVLRTDLRWPVPAALVCLGTLPVLLVRRTRPLLAVAVGFATVMVFNMVVWIATGDPGGVASSSFVLICIYALYRWGSGRDGLAGAAISAAGALIANLTDPGTVGEAIGGLVVLAIPVILGLLVRYRGVAAQRRTESVRAREREHLARDLHDSIAHHVSVIAVQAQAGKAVAAVRPEAALEVLDVIEREASRALAEMRSIVGALRAGDPAELSPQPGVADLHRLALGRPARVDVTIDPELDTLTPAVDTAMYRIAQEALTNALRHGRSVGTVRIDVSRTMDGVRLAVADDGLVVPGHRADTNGYGLAGMAERVSLLGGTFQAGPSPDGQGWTVTAEVPTPGGAR